MADAVRPLEPAAPLSWPYRVLRLFADVRPGEAGKALLLMSNLFLLLMAYYLMKPIREALLLSQAAPTTGLPFFQRILADTVSLKQYLGAVQAIAFIFVVKAFSRLSSRVPRQTLITRTTLAFILSIPAFYLLAVASVPQRTIGILFFVWIGVFNYFVPAQFWGFANDLYSEGVGKRTFPLIAIGASAGAVVGNRLGGIRTLLGTRWEYKIMLVAGAILLGCILMARYIHAREVRRARGAAPAGDAGAIERARVQEAPLKSGGAFKLVFRSRYLVAIAGMIGLLNFINATGEYILGNVQVKTSEAQVEREITRPAPTALPGAAKVDDVTPAERSEMMTESVHAGFMDYQFFASLVALFIQMFLVSRIFRWAGVGGALFVLPVFALFGYGALAMGATLALVRTVKSVENGIDYSLMNTTKAALFLVTTREEKYKAKAAIDTFFVRGGDTVSALVIFAGAALLSVPVERYALVNAVAVTAWIALCFVIVREYRRRKAAAEGAPAAAGSAAVSVP